jgi:hypothetical protein
VLEFKRKEKHITIMLFALLGFPGYIIVSVEADPFTALAVEERERENASKRS